MAWESAPRHPPGKPSVAPAVRDRMESRIQRDVPVLTRSLPLAVVRPKTI